MEYTLNNNGILDVCDFIDTYMYTYVYVYMDA